MEKIRNFGLLFLLCFLVLGCDGQAKHKQVKKDFPVQKTEEEWRQQLTAEQYRILRERGTEPRYSSPLIVETADGQMVCAACGNPLFENKFKYTTTSAWPSFDRPIKGAVTYAADFDIGYKRIEVLCAQCGGHLGHVFEDGPETTGMRYCIDGVALEFIPDKIAEQE